MRTFATTFGSVVRPVVINSDIFQWIHWAKPSSDRTMQRQNKNDRKFHCNTNIYASPNEVPMVVGSV